MISRHSPPLVLIAVALALAGSILLATSVSGQGGTPDADADALRHLEVGRLYEEAGDLDKAIIEYEAATIAKSSQIHANALAALQHVLNLKNDPLFRLQHEMQQLLADALKFFLLAGFILAVGGLVVYFAMRSSDSRTSLLIMPFTDLTGSSGENGSSIAENIANTLHQARLIHSSNQSGAILSISEKIDLPSFTSQHYDQGLVNTLGALNSLNVGGINLPIGSILQPLYLWLTSGRRRIVGSLQQFDQTYLLTARLEMGRAHRSAGLWQNRDEVSDGEVRQRLASMARTLAYEILLSMDDHWGTRSAKSLQEFTSGLADIQLHNLDSGDTAALKRAAEHFDQACTLDPGYNSARYNLAIALIGLGENERATTLLKSLRSSSGIGLEPEISYNLGIAYYQRAKDWAYEYSEDEFNHVVQNLNGTKSDSSQKEKDLELLALTHCGLASIYAQRVRRDASNAESHFKTAQEHVKTACSLVPANLYVQAVAFTASGLSYLQLRDYEKAVHELNLATQLKSNYSRAYVYQGQAQLELYQALGEKDRTHLDLAILALQQAAALNPELEYAQYQLAQALKKRGDRSQNDYERAVLAYSKAEHIALARDELGRLYAEKGEYDKAFEEFLQALKLNSKYSDAALDLAWFTLKAGHTNETGLQEALKYARQALELEKGKPSEPHIRTVLALVYLERNQLGEAEKELQLSRKLDGKSAQTLYYLALLLFRQNRLPEAKAVLVEFFALSEKGEWGHDASRLMAEIKKVEVTANQPLGPVQGGEEEMAS